MGETRGQSLAGVGVQYKVLLLRADGRRDGWEARAAWEDHMAGLWSPGVVDGDTASPSEPTLSIPRAQKAWQPHTRARRGPGCHTVPQPELLEAMWATQKQPETSPSPGPSAPEGPLDLCPRFPNRDAKAFSSQRRERLLKVTANQRQNGHCGNVIGNNSSSCCPRLWPNPVLRALS